MQPIRVLCALLLSAGLLFSHEIQLGDTRLEITAPDGYAQLTAEMQPYHRLSLDTVPESNESLLLFLETDMIAKAAAGGIPDANRRFEVQTAKTLVGRFVTAREFDELKRVLKTQNEELVRNAERRQLPEMLEKVSKSVAAETQAAVSFSQMQIIPMPPHEESARTLAYSMTVKFNLDVNGQPTPQEAITTSTFVHVRGRVLFLYVGAEKTGLEWSRAKAREWADAIIAANPSSEAVERRETAATPSRGFDWISVAKSAVIGAIIGGLWGLARLLYRRMRN